MHLIQFHQISKLKTKKANATQLKNTGRSSIVSIEEKKKIIHRMQFPND